jgi:uncharacterized coiled-coil protein SlyX
MTLQNHQAELEQKIAHQEEILSNLAAQIQQLQMELRWDKKKVNDQAQIAKEIEAWYAHGSKLMEDLCGAYPKEALYDVAEKVQEIAAGISEKYEGLAQDYTYLMREVDAPPPHKEVLTATTTEIEVLPPAQDKENPDGTLTPYGAEEIIKDLSSELLHKIASIFGSRATTPKGVAKVLADHLTREKVERVIETFATMSSRIDPPE